MNQKQVPQCTTSEDYQTRFEIELLPNASFYASLMAAYMQADSDNRIRLERAFPRACLEFRARYLTPGGCLTVREWERLENDTAEPDTVLFLENQIAKAWQKAEQNSTEKEYINLGIPLPG